MSFMFHPYPYVDPRAVNPVDCPEAEASVFGTLNVARPSPGKFVAASAAWRWMGTRVRPLKPCAAC